MTKHLHKSTEILINNFIDTFLLTEHKEEAKKEALEIVNSFLEHKEITLNALASKEDVRVVRDELKEDIRVLREETKADILANKEELRAVRDELKADIANLDAKLEISIANLNNKLEKSVGSLERNFTESKYDLLKWIFTAQIAVTSLAVAVMKLF